MYRKHVKEQKAKKDEVSRGSSKAPEKVGEEVETLKNILSNLANNIQQHSALVHKLKHDVALVSYSFSMYLKAKMFSNFLDLSRKSKMLKLRSAQKKQHLACNLIILHLLNTSCV
jgi:hypothetical protein